MYLTYFGLDKPPFRITPDTHLFFDGCDRGAILSTLCYAISQGEGIIKVVGEVGTGKTMLCRMLPLTVADEVDWVYLAHPSLSPEHTLHAIAFELGLEVAQNADKIVVMRALHNHLLERHHQGRKVVVLVEEAQSMPLETLEEIRLLSNLETEDHKLMQMVLFGQPELDDKLAQASIRQLRERITHGVNLAPFRIEDVQAYLNFRLRAVGYTGPDLFSVSVARSIGQFSKGLTRRINILADKMLIIAFSQNRHTLSMQDVKEAARDCEFTKRKSWWAAAVATYVFAMPLITLFCVGSTTLYLRAVPSAAEFVTAQDVIAVEILDEI